MDNNMTINYKEVLEFYKHKRVLITGNSGFKGSWLTYILLSAGADVTGYSLQPPTNPSLYGIIGLDNDERLNQIYADVRDLEALKKAVRDTKPEIVFHLAAQPIVRDSYRDPVTTYQTNVMGTVNVCEAIRTNVDDNGRPCVRSFLNITTDKVYRNNEWEWGYRETDYLDGFDPYSNSKSCSELVTHSYINSFFTLGEGKEPLVSISTARAGNVIGGGDFSNDRIIPDCIRAIVNAKDMQMAEGKINVRNPFSTRPYEHVLEPLFAYLLIAKRQYEDSKYAGSYNVGPDDVDCVCTGELVSSLCDEWNQRVNTYNVALNEGSCLPQVVWNTTEDVFSPHEANFLKLDCSKLKSTFGWRPRLHIRDAIDLTMEWTKVWLTGENDNDIRLNVKAEMDREIRFFVEDEFKRN